MSIVMEIKSEEAEEMLRRWPVDERAGGSDFESLAPT